MKPSKWFIVAVYSLLLILPAVAFCADESGQIITITAKRFEYNPNAITLKKGVPVTLELTSLDRLHGFNCPDLGIRADIEPGKNNTISFVPVKVGVFTFSCDIFCGDGHEGMEGKITVVE